MKILKDTELMNQSAYFGWQDKEKELYDLKEGYKNSADEVVTIVVNSAGNTKILYTYILPIFFIGIIWKFHKNIFI